MAILKAPKCSVVLVPYPYQGHVTPMLQLGSILHSKGFPVIVAHPEFNSPNPSNHPEFVFLPLAVDLSGLDTSTLDHLIPIITAINQNGGDLLMDELVPIMKDQDRYGRISCIIYDSIMKYGNSVANKLKIPSMVLYTYTAAYLQTYHTVLQLQAENKIPFQESKILEPIPELHPLRYKDLATSIDAEIPDGVMKLLVAISTLGTSVAIIWNSTEVLDHAWLLQLQQRYKVPSFPIGPFHKMDAAASSTSFLKEDRNCLAWLDKQAPQSVLYISLGSMAVIEQEELEETAWGLANCCRPFLWVIRPFSINGSEWIEKLPEGFRGSVGERGRIVKWAPQKEVLAHFAVGGFLSHCGWNSTLESICEGVPMICRPYFADQMANTRYITQVWKVGVELEHVTDRVAIERAIKMLMVDDEGKQMRENAMQFKQRLEASMQKGGSSYESLKGLTDFIPSIP